MSQDTALSPREGQRPSQRSGASKSAGALATAPSPRVVDDLALSTATTRAMELPTFLELVAELAATDLGAERIRGLRPFVSAGALRAHHRRFDDARRLLAGQRLVPSREREIAPILDAVEGHGDQLGGGDMLEIGALLRASHEAKERIEKSDPPCEALAEMVEDLPDLSELARKIRRTFDARGEIREDATPLLSKLRSRIRSTRDQIYDQLGDLVEEHRDHLSDDTVPMRGGRLVLKLQAGARGQVKGLTHGKSGSGKSFYFEPLEAVESNNRLQQAVDDEEAEKRRIFREILDGIRGRRAEILRHAELVAELDRLQASADLAETMDGRLAEIAERHDLRLVAARHPLLDPSLSSLRRRVLGTPGHTEPVVPLDLELSAERRALVVTGPNAGGKTVTLKTVGLLTLAHQYGLPIPAAKGTRLPFFDALVATVGDDQDLLTDRSTFSGRLIRLREAWDAASADALILLDELGSGTDPEEGAALSQALLEGLLERRSLVLVTTHLSQLAATALDQEGAFCAAMQFDDSTGEPTYRLLPGPPGGSEAIALAHRLNLPNPWLDRAEELLGSEHRELRRLLAEVEAHRRELAELKTRHEAEVADAAKLRERLQEREHELLEEKRTVGKTLRRQLDEFRRETRDKLRREIAELRKEFEGGRKKGLTAAAEKRLFEDAPDVEPVPVEERPIEVGGKVRHRGFGWEGELEKLERGKAQVKVGGKSLLCQAEDLVGVAEEAPKKPDKKVRVRATPTTDEPARELHLIGKRVEPALRELDRYLDRALLASKAEVRVVHGHGSGRLRKAVREHLDDHPAVARHRPGGKGEGGNGATVVKLAG